MTPPPTSAWRLFPWFVTFGMGIVVAVNVFMAFQAVYSFPGTATDASFATSNRYDQVLADETRQAALGWQITTLLDGRRPAILLRTRDGKPLEGARVVVIADRPAGGTADRRMDFRAATPGRYVAETALPEEGQWDLQLHITANAQTYRATRRILAP
jgi:nitrogen fixation protein FixH